MRVDSGACAQTTGEAGLVAAECRHDDAPLLTDQEGLSLTLTPRRPGAVSLAGPAARVSICMASNQLWNVSPVSLLAAASHS